MRTKRRWYGNFGKRVTALLLCLCMVIGIAPRDLPSKVGAAEPGNTTMQDMEVWLSGDDLNDTDMVVIVRHWRNGRALGDLEKFVISEDGTVKNPDGTTFAGDGTLEIEPLEEYAEFFKSFSLVAGQDAVEIDDDNTTATVTYYENIHVVKVLLYYSDPSTDYALADGMPFEDADPEKDVDENGYYNTSPGLHTNKFAEAVYDKDTGRNDGYNEDSGSRLFDLTLEAWMAGGATSSVGLILDASASMSFVSNADELQKIRIMNISVPGGKPLLLTKAQIDQILDKNYTDNSAMGYGGYSYFVFDARSTTAEFVPLGYWDGKNMSETGGHRYLVLPNGSGSTEVILGIENGTLTNKAGWYYVNGGSSVHDDTITDSAKEYRGLKPGNSVYNGITLFWKDYSGPSEIGASEFYLDADGYLHCVFNCNSEYYADSYVYFKSPEARIKTEELQNALGNFVNQLNANSAESEVSAIRFSSQNYDPAVRATTKRKLDTLLLQRWTKDPSVSTGIMNLDRGTGFDGSRDGLYNYALTGGTYTYTGLQAFKDYIAADAPATGNNKYIIIFTDGIDNNISNGYDPTNTNTQKSLQLANELKKAGWTIYTVILNGGFDIESNNSAVKKYLYDLSSSRPASDSNYGRYLTTGAYTVAGYDWDDHRPGANPYNYIADNAQELEEAFTGIMHQIVNDLDAYTVQDYIDPRFDLVDGNGTVIQLNAGGSIVIGNSTKKMINGETGHKFKTQDGSEAILYYDSDADMYYVKWVDQQIPDCEANTKTDSGNQIRIWRGTIRVQAKDDFIGGNAVLTNGNSGDQNMVYLQDDEEDTSSKTDKAGEEYEEGVHGPSKGFPRTAVNVKIFNPELKSDGGDFYLGETPEDYLANLLKSLSTEAENNLYYEYLYRYFEKCNDPDDAASAEAFKEAFLTAYYEAYEKVGKTAPAIDPDKIWSDFDEFLNVIAGTLLACGSFTLPYAYLPDSNEGQTNQTGSDAHEDDLVGDLTFVWKPNDTDDGGELTAGFDPYSAEDRAPANSDLIDEEGAYDYDQDYKPDGKEQGDTETEGEYVPEYVNGELALKMRVDADDFRWLFSEYGYWAKYKDAGVIFTVNVTRVIDEKGEPANDDLDPLKLVIKPAVGRSSEGDYVYFFTDDTTGNLKNLSKGTYKLTFAGYSASGDIASQRYIDVSFGAASPDEYDGHFTVNGDQYTVAGSDENGAIYFQLGTDDTPGKNYLDELNGMVKLEIQVDRGTLIVEKVLGTTLPSENADDAKLDENREFNFTVKLYESGAKTTLSAGFYNYQVYDANDNPVDGMSGMITDGTLTVKLKAGQYVKIENLPDDVYYVVTETAENGFEPNNGNNTSEGTVGHAEVVTVTFTNQKTRNPVSVSLSGTKTMTGDHAPDVKENDYTFTVTPTSGNPDDPIKAAFEVRNDASALIKFFNSVKYTVPGEYTYTVKENIENKILGVKYDTRTYTVKIVVEEEYKDGKYTGNLKATVYVNDKAVASGTDTVSYDALDFVNTFDQNANVTLNGKKTVNGGAPNKEFSFTLEFTGAEYTNANEKVPPVLSGTTATSDKTSGEFAFGEITFKAEGIYTFTITETNDGSAGYIFAEPVTVIVEVTRDSATNVLMATVKVNGVQQNTSASSSVTVQFTVNNTKLDDRDLTISKEVTGRLGETNKPFVFTVTLQRPANLKAENFPLRYTLSGNAAADNGNAITFTYDKTNDCYTATLRLKHNQSVTIEGLPEGTVYKVTETDYKGEGYTASHTSNEGTLNTGATVVFTNDNPAGSVKIDKEVTSPEISDKASKKFTFTLTLTKPGNWTADAFKARETSYLYTIQRSDGKEEKGHLTLTVLDQNAGTYTALLENGSAILLGHGESITLENLPVGTVVTVKESAEGFATTMTNDGKATVQEDGGLSLISVKNERDTGNMEVSKKVTAGDKNEAFTFTVTFTDANGNELTGEYAYETTGTAPEYGTFKSGASFTLKDGETFTIKGLPTGTVCVVKEVPADGYKTSVSVNGGSSRNANEATGTITKATAEKPVSVSVVFVNEKAALPEKTEVTPGDGEVVAVGDEIVYSVTWENYKNDLADVIVKDELMKGLKYIAGTAKAYRYDEQTGFFVEIGEGELKDGVLVWTMKDQPANSYGYVTFSVIVTEEAVTDEFGNKVVNDASVKVGDDTEVITNEVENPLSDPKKTEETPGDGEVVAVGDEIVYRVTWENYKETSADVTVRDELMKGLEYIDGTAKAYRYDALTDSYVEIGEGVLVDGVLVWTMTEQPAGAYGYVEFAVTVTEEAVTDEFGNKVVNDASVKVGDDKEVITNEVENPLSDPEKSEVTPGDGKVVAVGGKIVYRVTWENYKETSADVTVRDELMKGLEYIDGTAKAYRYDAQTDSYVEIGEGVMEYGVLIWTMTEQPAGAYGYVEFSVIVTEDAVTDEFGNKVVNDASVKVGDDKEVITNEVENPISDPEKIEVIPGAGKLVLVGSEITYEITWENYKSGEATVTITDPLDVGVEFVKAKFGALDDEEGEWYTEENPVEGIVYDAETHTVIWTLKDVPGETAGRVTLVVRVISEANVKAVVENQAIVQVDNDPAVYTEIIENPTPKTGVIIHKEQSVNDGERTTKVLQTNGGDIVTYYVTVTNIGAIPVEGLIVTDAIPEGLTLVADSISDNGTEIGGVITWEIGTLGVDESVTVSFKVLVPAVEEKTNWINIASESHTNPEDPEKPPIEQPSNEVEIFSGEPKLTIEKAQAVNGGEPTKELLQVKKGDTVTYYLTIKNVGTDVALKVLVTDEIPDGLSLIDGSISDNGILLPDGKTILWQLGDLAIGEEITVSFSVTVPEVMVLTTWKNVAYASYEEPEDPNDPVDPDDPTDPGDPTDPDDPTDPGDPGDPDDPFDPTDPHKRRKPVPSNEVEIEEPAPRIPSPPTGDVQKYAFWFTMFLASGIALVILTVVRRKRNIQKQK